LLKRSPDVLQKCVKRWTSLEYGSPQSQFELDFMERIESRRVQFEKNSAKVKNSNLIALVGLVTLGLCTFSAHGADWFVRPSAQGSASGRDWNNAWSLSGIGWSSVNAGDTIWVSGGSYSSGLNVGKSGTASGYISIKRVKSSDSVATSAAGWNSSFDSQVLVSSGSPLRVAQGYILIDGREDMGMRFTVANGSGLPTSCDVTGGRYVTLTNLDLVGPNSANYPDGSSCGSALATFNGDCSGVMIGYGYSPNPGADFITVTHCRVRGHPNEFWFAQARNITIEHCRIYDNGAANSAQWHGNLMIVNGSDGIVFRYNDVSNWQVEGLYPWGGVSRNWHVYGNVFHDGLGGPTGSTHRFFEIRSYSGTITHGPMYVYNNTIANCWAAFRQGDSTVFWSSDSVARNNLIYNVSAGIGYLPPNAGNNITTVAGAFANMAAKDYHIVATASGSYPKDAGVAVANVPGHTYNLDRDGRTRGSDGAWDIGAYEFGSGGGPSTNPIISVNPISLSFGTIASGTTKDLSFTVRNIGGGILAGSISIGSPFSVVSGGSYSLSSNQSQTVTLRYNPTAAGSHTQVATFSGGGGTTVTVSGAAFAVLGGLSFDSFAGTISSPFVANSGGGYISQVSETSVTAGGQAVYGVNIPTAGSYVVQISVNAPNESANSLFVNFDGQPTDPAMIWDIPVTSGFVNLAAAWRGNGTFDSPQYVPAVFNLTAGVHQLIIRGREGGVQIGRITIAPAGAVPPNPPQNLRVTASL